MGSTKEYLMREEAKKPLECSECHRQASKKLEIRLCEVCCEFYCYDCWPEDDSDVCHDCFSNILNKD